MKYTLLKNNEVKLVVICESLAKAQELFSHEYTVQENQGESQGDLLVDGQFQRPVLKKPIMSKLKFLAKFTNIELASFYALAKTDVMTEVLKDKISMAEFIDLNEKEISDGLDYLILKGILTTQRKEEILA